MTLRTQNLKIAVVGAGISGLGAAWLMGEKHQVTVFEADSHFGGHANTVTANTPVGAIDVDTGFIVCNDRNYPNFLALMQAIGVEVAPTDMSFGVSIGNGDFEYAGADSLGPLFAQKKNILRLRFWRMVRALLKFYRETNVADPSEFEDITLGDFLREKGYSQDFVRDHILPMAACVWSTPCTKVGDFPLTSYLRFCQNHGLLQVSDRPQWFTVPEGSKTYVKHLMDKTNAVFRKNTPVQSISREDGKVIITLSDGTTDTFDKVLIATHANTALQLIANPDTEERHILGSFSYAKNRAVLHSDKSFMPKREAAWASWNYLQSNADKSDHLSVTYWMNRLQHLPETAPLFVTLNPTHEPAADSVYYEKEYEHPIFDLGTLAAQKQLTDIMGRGGIYYAGAHFGYGFHEDGLQSGLFAAESMTGQRRPWIIPDMNGRIIALQNAGTQTEWEAAE